MKQLKPYLPVLYAFLLDLMTLGNRVVRQVVLPGRRRTGNLLSSLFLLFAGVAERLIGFRKALLRIPPVPGRKIPAQAQLRAAWQRSKRHLRRGMLIAGWLLFILSSLEWATAGDAITGSGDPQPAAIVTAVTLRTKTGTETLARSFPTPANPGMIDRPNPNTLPSFLHAEEKRWLLLCTLRI